MNKFICVDSHGLDFPIQNAYYLIHAVNRYFECGGQRSVLGTVPQVPCHSLWFLETGSGAFRLGKLAGQWTPVNPAPAFLVLGLQWCPPHLSSYTGSGHWVQSLKLSTSISPTELSSQSSHCFSSVFQPAQGFPPHIPEKRACWSHFVYVLIC